MDAVALERVSEADFHDYFAPDFGRREAREHSRHYLQALLVQSEERRNAENVGNGSGVVTGVTAVSRRVSLGRRRGIDRLQEYLGSRLEDPQGVGCWTAAIFPSRG